MSFGTVYRNLNFLKEHGFVKEFIVDKLSRYESRVDTHLHLVCEHCHQIFDLDDESLAGQLKELAGKAKFMPRWENFEIRGYCVDCQKKINPRQGLPELFCIACGNLVDELEKEAAVCVSCSFKSNCNYYEKVGI